MAVTTEAMVAVTTEATGVVTTDTTEGAVGAAVIMVEAIMADHTTMMDIITAAHIIITDRRTDSLSALADIAGTGTIIGTDNDFDRQTSSTLLTAV